MSASKWSGLVFAGTLATATGLTSYGCSSSSNSPATGTNLDSGTQGDVVIVARHPDAGAIVPDAAADVAANTGAFDGTTGKACQSNADCQGGAGINVCSNGQDAYGLTIGGSAVTPWSTPICIVPISATAGTPGNCDPGPQGVLQFCDSADPTDPASPGICLPVTNPQQAGAGNGICFPTCRFALDGTPATGCQAGQACALVNILLNVSTNAVTGFGACQGFCTTDAECSTLGAGFVCQADLGFCVQQKKARTKTIGTSCTNLAANAGTQTDTSTGACNCFALSGITAGYCTSSCISGGPACPNGWTCETGEPTALDFVQAAPDGGDLNIAGPMKQTPGLYGTCFQPCALPDAGAPDDAGEAGAGDGGASTCLPLSTCTAGTVAGPDCQPM